ncbi:MULTISPECIES: DUF3040 domain-containing protein [Gordonia]|uniref:Membrane protein n=1 Tax=Gordonia alkanivorans CGMCC 6845 TaxID=1423140 RepID=W9DFF4_9ACTN|nr:MULTISPECIES: DUF3040 domain-containing protein [Gordonia]AZZ83714.1 DUF3040 domain-containing protein [Gordonia alkanivorans]ETA05146.1 membrane protein [Gordonia alkanivorans CGMCC 6845]MDH3007951.1 DUF3040 domain-containing protein [Gordonia alkanivorans]MDH3012023.1 DUF3040 domain-containing protein [Gordonia alkanivorans]MDH3016688.1 DUF3040 domain-containing protein [Gordonia alkanivorans]
MPLSEHEQRMLEQIESALYAEDPKFASSVKRRRLGKSSGRRRLQAVAIFVVGLVMLVGGLIVKIDIGGFPIVSLLGFLVMFGAGLFALWGDDLADSATSAPRAGGKKQSGSSGSKRKLSERMEERFNRRFEQE